MNTPLSSSSEVNAFSSSPAFLTCGEDGIASWELAFHQELAVARAESAPSERRSLRLGLWALAATAVLAVAAQSAFLDVTNPATDVAAKGVEASSIALSSEDVSSSLASVKQAE